jgi:hypothetical protein
MLVTPENKMAGIMPFASLTDAAAVPTEQWRLHIVRLLLKRFIKMVTLLSKRSEYFASISILLVTENILASMTYNYG